MTTPLTHDERMLIMQRCRDHEAGQPVSLTTRAVGYLDAYEATVLALGGSCRRPFSTTAQPMSDDTKLAVMVDAFFKYLDRERGWETIVSRRETWAGGDVRRALKFALATVDSTIAGTPAPVPRQTGR